MGNVSHSLFHDRKEDVTKCDTDLASAPCIEHILFLSLGSCNYPPFFLPDKLLAISRREMEHRLLGFPHCCFFAHCHLTSDLISFNEPFRWWACSCSRSCLLVITILPKQIDLRKVQVKAELSYAAIWDNFSHTLLAFLCLLLSHLKGHLSFIILLTRQPIINFSHMSDLRNVIYVLNCKMF